MNGHMDIEWNDLAVAWRADPDQEPLRATMAARVRRHTLAMRMVTAFELAILAGVSTFAWWVLRENTSAVRVSAISGVVALALAIQAFALWNRRGVWRALSDSPDAHLVLSERRANAKLCVARAVRVLAAVQTAAVLLLVVMLRDPGNPGGVRVSVAVEIALAMYAGYWSWSIWYEQRARAELQQLRVARVLLGSGVAMQ